MLLAFVLATLAADQTPQPYLLRWQDSGFTMPAMYRTEMCAIFPDHVLIRRTLSGQVQTEEVRAITLHGNFDALIAGAAAGEQTWDTGPTDAPSIRYRAYRTINGQLDQVDLGSFANATITHNNAPEARGLKAFLDAHCPPM